MLNDLSCDERMSLLCVVLQLSIMEAVSAQLIDLQSGTYHDQTTGEVMPLSVAIQRGLVSAAVAADGDSFHRDSQPMEPASGDWNVTETSVAGSRQIETKETLTRKVETKTVVDISSLPRHAVSGEALTMTGSSPALVTNGIALERDYITGEPVKGVEELDNLIAKMKESAGLIGDDRDDRSGLQALPTDMATGLSQIRYENGGIVTTTETSGFLQSSVVKTTLKEAVHVMDPTAGRQLPLTLDEALSNGLIDIKTGLLIDPMTGQIITIGEAVARGIIDGQASMVVDPSTGQPVSLTDGLKSGIVDGKTGKIRNTTTGREVSIQEAVHSGVISQKYGAKKQEPVTLEEALSNGLIDTKTGLVTDPTTGQRITISEAVARGIIDGQASMVVDPSTGRPVSLTDGLKSGIVDGTSGKIVKLDTGESVSMSKAAESGLIMSDDAGETKLKQKMMTEEAITSGLLDVKPGLMTDPVTGRQMTLQQAAMSGLMDRTARSGSREGDADGVAATVNGTSLMTSHTSAPLGTSQSASSAVSDIAQVSYSSSSQLLPVCNDAVHVITGLHCVGLTDDLVLSVLQSETGDGNTDIGQAMVDTALPVTAQDYKQSMKMELEGDDDVEAALQIVELSDLLHDKNLPDTEQPKLATASSMTLLEAFTSGLADSTTGLFEDPHSGKKMPLREAVEQSLVVTGKIVVSDTARDETVSLQESVDRQIVDADFTTFVDTKAGRQLTFTDAIREGFIREDDRIPTLSELAADGRYDPSTGTVIDPNTGQQISLLEAIESNLLDRQSVRLLDPTTGADVTLAEAFERGILDPDTGKLLDTYTGQAMNLVDSVNKAVLGLTTACSSVVKPPTRQQGPSVADKHIRLDGSNVSEPKHVDGHSESRDIVEEGLNTYSITDAIRDKIYDPKTNTVTDPVSGQQMSLQEAVEIGLIDASRAMVRDPRTGHKVAFEVLVEMGLIDINSGMVRDSQGRHIPLEDAVLSGLMFENPPLSGPLTLLQLVDEGLFKVETSEFFDPSSGELVSLHEAVVRSLLDPQSIVVHEIGSSEVLGIQDAINVGVIDAESGRVRDNSSREVISLADALDRNIVLGKPLPIVTAIDIGLLNETTAKFLDPSSRKFFSLASATESGLIDSDSCFTDPATGRAISVARAVTCGVLDPESGCVTNVHTGDVMTLREAITAAKLMAPSSGKLMSVDEAISLGLFTPSSNVFIDPHTREELTLEAAVAAGLLDSNSIVTDSATGRRITVAEIINEAQLDSSQTAGAASLSLQEAVELGYYNTADGTVVNPNTGKQMTLAEAVHSGIIDGTKKVMTVNGKEVSLQDAIQKGLIDALSSAGTPVMPVSDAVSCKVVIDDDEDKEQLDVQRMSDDGLVKPDGTVTDTVTGKKMTDAIHGKGGKKLNMPLQEVLQMGLFIEDTGKVENPETHELLTVQVAFDTCLIDKDSVKFKHPTVGLLMSFEQAVESELVDPSTGDVMSPEDETLTLKEAVCEGLVITAVTDKGLSLIDVVQQGVYDPRTCTLTHPFSGVEMTVQEGIETGLIDTRKTRVCDPNQQEMSTEKAISQNLIDTEAGRYVESEKDRLTLGEAITKNYLIDVKLTKLSVDEAVDRGLFDVKTGIFVDPVTGKQMKIMEAIKSGLLDPSQTLLTSPDGNKMLTLNEAVAAGMVDVNTGELINVQTGQRMSFVEATDKGLVLDTYVPPMMSFTEASTKGLFDRRTGNFSHPVTGTRMNFEAAINTGLVDVEKCQLIMPGSGELSTLAVAVDENLVDDKFVQITEPSHTHTALLVDVLSDVRLAPAQYQRRQLVSGKGMQDTSPSGDAGSLHGSEAVISEVENEKQEMDTITSSCGIAGPTPAAVDDSTDSKVTWHSVSSESGVTHDVWCAVRGMTLYDLINSNLFDRDTCSLISPDTGISVSLSDVLVSGILDFSNVAVRSLVNGQVFDFHTACKNGTVDLNSGSVYYPATGNWLGLVDAIDRGIVFDTTEGQTTVQELVDQGLFDITSSMFVHPQTKVMMNLEQCMECGLLNASELLIMLPATHEGFTLHYAICNGLVDTQHHVVTSPLTGKMFRLVDLCSEVRSQRQPAAGGLTLKQAVVQGLLNVEMGRVRHPVTGEWLTLAEALDAGIISAADTMVIDYQTGGLISLDAAIEAHMVDTRTAEMVNPVTGSRTSLFAALERGLGLSVKDAVSAGLFNNEMRKFVNPDTSEEMTLTEAIDAGVIDVTSSFMADADTGLQVSLNEVGMTDESTGLFTDLVTGKEAVKSGVIDTEGTVITDPMSGKEMSLADALQQRIVDDQSSRKITSEMKAQMGLGTPEKGPLQMKMTVREAVEARLIDPNTGLVTDPRTGQTLSLQQSVESGIVDGQATKVSQPESGRMLPLTEALNTNLVDFNSNQMIDANAARSVILMMAVDQDIVGKQETKQLKNTDQKRSEDVTEMKAAMTVDEAMRSGLLDSSTGFVTDPSSGRQMTLSEAVKAGIIDGEASNIVNPSTGQTVSLSEGLRLGIVDGRTGKVVDRPTGRTVGLEEVMRSPEFGKDVTKMKAAMTVDEAMRSGLLDSSTGLVTDPSSGHQMTLSEAVKAGIIDGEASNIVNPSTGQTVSLSEGLRLGIVDRRTGKVVDRTTGITVGLEEVVRSPEFGNDVTKMKAAMTVDEAMRSGLLDSSTGLVTDPSSGRQMTLSEAVIAGIIDGEASNIVNPSTGQTVSLSEGLDWEL